MKIVVVSPFVYGSTAGHGGATMAYGQLRWLLQRHEVHFISFFDGSAHDADLLAELQQLCASVQALPLRQGRLHREWARIRHVLKRRPLGAEQINSVEMRELIRSATTAIGPDVVILQFPQMAQYVTDCGLHPTVMDVQDAFSVSGYRSYSAAGSLLRRARNLLNWLLWLSYEKHFYCLFSALFTLTEQDSAGLRIFSPELSVDVIPASIEAGEGGGGIVKSSGRRIAFVGSFNHPPNADGVKFFLEEILPLVTARLPDVEFHIAGPRSMELFGSHASASVVVHGFVADITAFYASADVVVVPLRFGGGVKIKTIEAMANGCALVSTAIGAEETGIQEGVHALLANAPGQFANQVLRLLLDSELRRQLADEARALAENNFSWQARGMKLEQLLSRVVRAHSG